MGERLSCIRNFVLRGKSLQPFFSLLGCLTDRSSDFLPSISRAQQEEGLRRLGIYQTWFYQHIIPLSEDRCPESLLVLPWTNGEPDYRDKYRDGPQRFTGVGFFFYNVGPYANAPEILVPGKPTLQVIGTQ